MALELQRHTEESLVLALFDLVNHMSKNGEALAMLGDLTVQQWLVLLQIAGDPNFPSPGRLGAGAGEGVLASEIATARGVSRANVSALVAALLRKNLVRQTADPKDRRRKVLKITAAGRAALETIEPVRRRVNTALFRGFDREELDSTLTLLRRCLGKLWSASKPALAMETATSDRDGADPGGGG